MPVDNLTRERVTRIVNVMPALVGVSEGQSSGDFGDEYSWRTLINDYFRVMEIAYYIRRGGVKAMMYRIETGRTKLAPTDYFDEAQEKLSEIFRDIYLPPPNDQPVLDRLEVVTQEEEELVKEFLPEIDHILLSEKRREAVTSED